MPTCYVIGGGKGGVGKSTIAIHLAVYLAGRGLAVAVVDCDTKQQTSAKFFARTSRYSIAYEVIEKDLLRNLSEEDRAVTESYYSGFDAVVFDAPGDIEVGAPLFRIADVVVLPSRPQFPDVEELAEAALAVTAIRTARRGGLPETLVMLTQGAPRTNVAKEALRELSVVQRDLRIPVSLNQLHYSVKFSEAYSSYVTVPDLKGAPVKPKEQILNAMKEIEEYGRKADAIKRGGSAEALGARGEAQGESSRRGEDVAREARRSRAANE